MRVSSSLQDLSTYSKVTPREADLEIEIDRSYTRAKPFRALEKEVNGSSFSKEKSLTTAPSKRRKWVRAAVGVTALLLLFLLIYVCSQYFGSSFSNETSGYYVILDCGSTGTRVYVYEGSVDRNKVNVNLPIVLRSLPRHEKFRARSGRAYQRMETEPGFDKLVHNESGLKAAVKPLLHWAEKQIPKHARKTTPLYVYATAGVRRLPRSDSEWLLNKVWSILKHSSFLCQRDWVKIISGVEEAYYGWIALNYQMGTLGSVPSKETYGSLDLGGSSLQVTFETEKPMHDETSINLSIGAASHHLSAYSLSGYGLNDAFDKSVAHLFREYSRNAATVLNNGKIELKHPCLQNGYREQYICSHCSAPNKDGSPQIGGQSMGKGQPRMAVELVGSPQWEECSALAKTAVNLSEWSDTSSGFDCKLRPCAFSDNYPVPRGHFYAMSGFFVVFRFFNLTSEATLDDVLHRGQDFCGKTWEVAKNSVIPQPFIEQYCFRAPYIVSLLKEGLHITDNQVVIGSGSITWTLGVALLKAGEELSRRFEFHGYGVLHKEMDKKILLFVLLISIILLFCVLSCVTNWKPRFLMRPLLPTFMRNSASASKINIPSPFRFQRWSPINSGDGRVKMPLSPTIAGSDQHPFSMGHGLGGSNIQLMESSMQPLGFGVSHSYSSSCLGHMQYGNGTGSFLTPLRGQTTLQSRRSQSREDLISSMGQDLS